MEREDPKPTGPTCGECHHAKRTAPDPTKRLCHEGPPSVFPLNVQGQMAGVSMRPQVSPSDEACGRFTPSS